MLNPFFILIRTFPFWGVPLGTLLILQGVRLKKKHLIFFGVVIIAASIAFLYFRGPFMAVPFAHELINAPR